MLSHSLITLLGMAAAVSAMPPRPRTLAADDVILLHTDGTSRIMKAAAYDALETAAAAPASITSYNQSNTPALVPRGGCAQSTEVQVTSDERFLNWDVAISPVLSSQGDTQATVGVSSGYEIENTLEIGHEITFGGEEIISVSLGLNLHITWSSSQESSVDFEIPNGKFGVIVSQPYVRRIQGNVFSGCTDNPTKTPFMADTYESQSYGNLAWVKGIIRLCSSDTYPIPFCIGEGQHH